MRTLLAHSLALLLAMVAPAVQATACQEHFDQSLSAPEPVLRKTGRAYVLEHLQWDVHPTKTQAVLTDCGWGIRITYSHYRNTDKAVNLARVKREIDRFDAAKNDEDAVLWGIRGQYEGKPIKDGQFGAWGHSGLRKDLTTCACAAFFPDVVEGKTPIETLR